MRALLALDDEIEELFDVAELLKEDEFEEVEDLLQRAESTIITDSEAEKNE